MKKSPLPEIFKHQLFPARYGSSPGTNRTPTKKPGGKATSLQRRRPVNYVPGEIPRSEPSDAPRLFVRGCGGSIKMDLRGVGTRLSGAAFAYQVPDGSLVGVDIHRGDILLIEPICRAFRSGSLVLLELDGRPTLRRFTQKNRVWWLNPVDGSDSKPLALVDQGLQGTVVGLVRLFTKIRPVKFRGTEENYAANFERAGARIESIASTCVRANKTGKRQMRDRAAKRDRRPFLLAAEKDAKYRPLKG